MYFLYGLMKRTHWPLDKLRRYQNKKTRKIVRYAYDNVPFYNSRFKELGITPDEIRTLEDLNKLPILRKDDIRKNLPLIISREYDIAQLRVMHTSGSTGKPLSFYVSQREDEYRKAKQRALLLQTKLSIR
jgi:phenylacetate-CoA ligase